METIKIELTRNSINSAIRQLNAYKQSIIEKNEEFIRRLSDIGLDVIKDGILAAKGDSDKNNNTYVTIHSYGGYSEAILTCEGRDILFIEFGAGVHYNGPAGSSPHPYGVERGYTIGSYGKHKGKYDKWAYIDDDGALRWSQGTEAAMPMYHAYTEMREKVLKIAKEVFE